MKTLISFFNGQAEKANLNGLDKFSLSTFALSKIRGGDGHVDIWLPDEEKTVR